ncbi:MAG: hypothetical protein ACN4E2_06355 [Nitrospinota bacterium]
MITQLSKIFVKVYFILFSLLATAVATAFLFFSLLITAISLIIICMPDNYANVRLINHSNETIKYVTIETSGPHGSKAEFHNIEIGQSRTAIFKIESDCHYLVDVTFVSDKKVYAELGYLSHGISINDELLIFDKKIGLKSGKHTHWQEFLVR